MKHTISERLAAALSYITRPEKRRLLFLWLLLLCIAPFAIEIIFLADVVGIELAMAFLVYYAKAVAAKIGEFVYSVKSFCINSCQILGRHSVSEPRYWWLHTCVSTGCLLITGSAISALLIWYPVVILGVQALPMG